METIIKKVTKSYTPYPVGKPLIWILAIAINLLIGIAFFLPGTEFLKQPDFSFLPLLNAILNSLTFLSLIIALFAIKQQSIKRHNTFVVLALLWTSLFLISYLVYQFSTASTKFGGQGLIKYIYFFILLTHVLLAAIIVPLVLISIGHGLDMEDAKQKKIAMWTMPIWLYVSLTGVIVYLLILPYGHYDKKDERQNTTANRNILCNSRGCRNATNHF